MAKKKRKFYCKHCGRFAYVAELLVQSACNMSPSRHHELYEHGDEGPFTCKFCGRQSMIMELLCQSSCAKSPTRKHQPL